MFAGHLAVALGAKKAEPRIPLAAAVAVALGWSTVGALVGRRILGSWRAGAILGALVLSHWILDFITHRPDLPLWPGGPQSGLGLWNSVPGTILLEGSLLAVGVWLYLRATSRRDAVGRWALIGLVGLVGLIWVTQPWSPPPPTSAAVAWGALILWLLPPWAAWIEKNRAAVGAA